MRVRALLPAAVLLVPGCGGGSGPVDPPTPREILVVSIARSDRSAGATLEGYVAFFFDRDRETLLDANATVDRINPDGSVFSRTLQPDITPGIVPGEGYSEGINVDPGRSFRLHAVVQREDGSQVQVSSAEVSVPSEFTIEVPDEVVAGEPFVVTWAVTNAEMVNISVDGGVFSAHAAAGAGTFTVPAAATMGRPPGQEVEVELTAYNTFYEPLGAAISSLSNAEAAAEKFRGIDNVDGGVGVFGGAYTLGRIVTVQ